MGFYHLLRDYVHYALTHTTRECLLYKHTSNLFFDALLLAIDCVGNLLSEKWGMLGLPLWLEAPSEEYTF